MALSHDLEFENDQTTHSFKLAISILRAYAPRLPIRVSNGLKKIDLLKHNATGDLIGTGLIKEQYEKVTDKRERLEGRAYRTGKEWQFEYFFKSLTGIKPVPSCWIGPFCVDFFLPQLGGRWKHLKWQGLAIEIDGGIHNQEAKIKKDTYKSERLLDMGIYVMTILNKDVGKIKIADLLQQLDRTVPLDWRAQQRIMTKIRLLTIFALSPFHEIDWFFNVAPGTTRQLTITIKKKDIIQGQ